MQKTKLNHIGLLLVLIFSAGIVFSQHKFTDKRDGQTYKTVKIGKQVWMAKNLNFKTENSWCYDDNTENCKTYGRLYTWEVAKDENTCPEGWHLPSDAEWRDLIKSLGGKEVAGGKMKEKGTSHWDSPNAGATDSYGFNALPGGNRYSVGSFYYLSSIAFFWTATELDASYAGLRFLLYNNAEVYRYYYFKSYGFSVRCVQDY